MNTREDTPRTNNSEGESDHMVNVNRAFKTRDIGGVVGWKDVGSKLRQAMGKGIKSLLGKNIQKPTVEPNSKDVLNDELITAGEKLTIHVQGQPDPTLPTKLGTQD